MSLTNVEVAIGASVPAPYGRYAVKSLVEDYVYYCKLMGMKPEVSEFLSRVRVIDDFRGLRIEVPEGVMGHDEMILVWNNKKKRWDGFKEVLDKKFESNMEMLSKFPGSEQGLRALFSGPGFSYDGRKIDFKTYMGIVDVVLDMFEGQQTISIDDPEGSYVWDPKDISWSVLD